MAASSVVPVVPPPLVTTGSRPAVSLNIPILMLPPLFGSGAVVAVTVLSGAAVVRCEGWVSASSLHAATSASAPNNATMRTTRVLRICRFSLHESSVRSDLGFARIPLGTGPLADPVEAVDRQEHDHARHHRDVRI